VKGWVLLGMGVGYVAGTRAGRDRYRQIVTVSQKLADVLEQYATGGGTAAPLLEGLGSALTSSRDGSDERADETEPTPASGRGRRWRASSPADDGDRSESLDEFDELVSDGVLAEQAQRA